MFPTLYVALYCNLDFKFHPRCKKLNLVYLGVVDDLFFFLKRDHNSVRQLFIAFELFSSVSGLKANQAKCVVYFGGASKVVQDVILAKFGISGCLSSKKLNMIQFRL